MKNIKNIIEQKYPPENPNDLWMKDNVLYKSTHKGWTPLTVGGGSSTNGVTSTTWQELKDKRDNGQLIPGSLYRITDYNCTTTQENTKSAGHQFDIVLLALSENKLAEEGWAMEHPADVYDVTFADVTKKCYLYRFTDRGEDVYNIVDSESLLGISSVSVDVVIVNDVNKTATFLEDYIEEYPSDVLTEENLPYNYFQNSNLSAWKVWYCLDNDKSRFAWADDGVDISSITLNNNARYSRKEDYDVIYEGNTYFAWYNPNVNTVYTLLQIPTTSDKVFRLDKGGNPEEEPSYSILNVRQGTGLPNGRGVIYRLIDEWNNDVGYDFKNIQFVRKLTNGQYDASTGTDTWVYTFSFNNEGVIDDLSISGDMKNGFINSYYGADSHYALSNNVILNPNGFGIELLGGMSGYCTITQSSGLSLWQCDSLEIDSVDNAIYVAGKKVLTKE